eukprot:TRINITY_DN112224_c0_g1_i1.p1 TRINITY_DN112224_c0_g1~~TRINITY_DN112224_c0_g1_i1.p1  ORF type:complete len:259 (+),score=45.77 TRINITY_DN112224_c0_g1_i1:41-817(+)
MEADEQQLAAQAISRLNAEVTRRFGAEDNPSRKFQLAQSKSFQIQKDLLRVSSRKPESSPRRRGSGAPPISQADLDRAWKFVNSSILHPRLEEDLSPEQLSDSISIIDFRNAVRCFDPCISYMEVQHVLGKSRSDTISRADIAKLLEGAADINAYELAWENFSNEHGELDVQKVTEAFSLAGAEGMSETMVREAVQRKRQETGETDRSKLKLEADMTLADFRKAFKDEEDNKSQSDANVSEAGYSSSFSQSGSSASYR